MSTVSFRSLLYSTFDISSTQSSLIVEQLRAVKDRELSCVDFKNCIVLQCKACNTVLGDSLGICGEAKNLESIICLKVTDDVIVNEKLETSLNGQLASTTYKPLQCGGCHDFVGLVLHSTPEHLSALRNLFLLRKELLSCYMLRSGKFVSASEINFSCKPMAKTIKELKQDLEEQMKLLEGITEKLCTSTVKTIVK